MKLFLAGVLSLFIASTSFAQTTTREDEDCAKAKKAGRACSLTFEGDKIGGERPTAGGENIGVRGQITHSNLIKVRTSFRSFIIRSAENL